MSKHEIDFVLTGQYFKIEEIMETFNMLLHDEGVVAFERDAIKRASDLLSQANVLINLIRR